MKLVSRVADSPSLFALQWLSAAVLLLGSLFSYTSIAEATPYLVLDAVPILRINMATDPCRRGLSYSPPVCRYWPGQADGHEMGIALVGFESLLSWGDANFPWNGGWDGSYPDNGFTVLENCSNQTLDSQYVNVSQPSVAKTFRFTCIETKTGVTSDPFARQDGYTTFGEWRCPDGFNNATYFTIKPTPVCTKVLTQPAETCGSSSGASPPLIGNPIEPVTGAKVYQVTDYSTPSGLTLSRFYNSNTARTLFDHERFSLTASNLPASGAPALPPRYYNSVYFDAEYGKAISVPHRILSDSVFSSSPTIDLYLGSQSFRFQQSNGVWTGDPRFGIQVDSNATTGYRYRITQQGAGTVWWFDDQGRLLEQRSSDGQSAVRYTYQSATVARYPADAPACTAPGTTSTQLAIHCMTDATGRTLQFQTDADAHVTQALLPDGRAIHYADNAQGLIERVTFADGSGQLLHYNEPGLATPVTATNAWGLQQLTGLSDVAANGTVTRHSRYAYDATSGRAVSTELTGGVGRYVLAYTTPGYLTTVTDPLGAVLTLGFEYTPDTMKLASQTQPAGSGCAAATQSAAYDAKGNVTSRTDFNGVVTSYPSYDLARGLELKRVEASATPAARTISTQWHPAWQLKVREAAPKLITTSVYNGQPDPTAGGAVVSCAPADALVNGLPIAVLCKQIEQATSDATGAAGFAAAAVGAAKVSSWTYTGRGQVVKAIDTRGAVTQNAYYTDTNADHMVGDLQSTTAADGTVMRFTRYDRNGRVLTQVDPTNVTTTYAYHPRGWLNSVTRTASSGEAEVTQYTYTSFGQLATATSADASRITYTYDAAHRLTDIADNLGNKIHYTLDAMGNRVGEDTKDSSGTLARRVQRTVDALNRVQHFSGAAP